jgi:hypothetical protein
MINSISAIILVTFVLMGCKEGVATEQPTLPNDRISLSNVVTNTQKNGSFPLVQGFSGSFSFTKDSYLVNIADHEKFEFTHALLNTQGTGSNFPKAQALIVCLDNGKDDLTYIKEALYIDNIPSSKQMMGFNTILDFKKIFGDYRGYKSGWSFIDGEHTSMHWIGFTRMKDGTIRVVTVFLWIVNKGDGWEIDNRRVGEGIFKPTREIPILEKSNK